MKYFNHKIIGIAMMCATVMACTDKYDCNLQVEKPEEVAKSDHVLVMDQGEIKMEGTPDEILLRDKELIRLHLDIPFSIKLQQQLKKNGLTMKPEITIEGLVNQLCQFDLKN